MVHAAHAHHVQQMRPRQRVQPLDAGVGRRHLGGEPQPGDARRRHDGVGEQRAIRIEAVGGGREERGGQIGARRVGAVVAVEQTVDGL